MSFQHSFRSERLPLPVPALRPVLRRLAVQALQHASAKLARTAARLETAQPAAATATPQQCVEFHADPDTLEGAVYVDGRLVARLPGVRRL